MSAAERQSPNVPPQPEKQSPDTEKQRPSLLKPPARPARPAPAATDPPLSSPTAADLQPTPPPPPAAIPAPPAARNLIAHPIAPPSEPMQYRAIGLVRGVYTPTEADQLNRGLLLTDDGVEIDAVLLGRVTSLVKKHLDLQASHLWVVYPRTRTQEPPDSAAAAAASSTAAAAVDLHLQIVGVWEPETLGMPGENPRESTANRDETDTDAAPGDAADAIATVPTEASAPPAAAGQDTTAAAPLLPSENYFSIRGEVVDYTEEQQQIVVKILQGAKRPDKAAKAFRLHLIGQITGKTVGYFWEFDVERQAKQLVVVDGRSIRIVPPKKKKKRKRVGHKGRRPGPRGHSHPTGPDQPKDKPRIRPSAPVKSNPL